MDAKKLEIIKKLIRLANNNPNEHEANLAARKVCIMLADYQFYSSHEAVFGGARAPGKTGVNQSANNPSSDPIVDWMNDLFRKAEERTKQDGRNPFQARWSKNNTYKPHPKQEEFYKSYDYVWWDELNHRPANPDNIRHNPETNTWSEDGGKTWRTEKDYYAKGQSPPKYEFRNPTYEPPKPKPPKIQRVCSECGATVETRDHTYYFICSKCHWHRYHKEKGEAV